MGALRRLKLWQIALIGCGTLTACGVVTIVVFIAVLLLISPPPRQVVAPPVQRVAVTQPARVATARPTPWPRPSRLDIELREGVGPGLAGPDTSIQVWLTTNQSIPDDQNFLSVSVISHRDNSHGTCLPPGEAGQNRMISGRPYLLKCIIPETIGGNNDVADISADISGSTIDGGQRVVYACVSSATGSERWVCNNIEAPTAQVYHVTDACIRAADAQATDAVSFYAFLALLPGCYPDGGVSASGQITAPYFSLDSSQASRCGRAMGDAIIDRYGLNPNKQYGIDNALELQALLKSLPECQT